MLTQLKPSRTIDSTFSGWWLRLLALVLCAVQPVSAEAADWELRSSSGPSARSEHALAHDSQRNRTVLFGGRGLTSLADTWEWDGTQWQSTTAFGPAPRFDHAMAFDAARGETVLFGGVNETGGVGETWVWDGSQWTERLPVSSPSIRSGAGMVFDSQRGKLILFGGLGSGFQGDTWEWDGTDWTNVCTSCGPSPRYAHGMAYDSQRDCVVLFGGWDGSVNGETWELSGGSWSLVATTGPSARFGLTMVYDEASRRTFLFGGSLDGAGSMPSQESWVWNGVAWTQLSPNTMPSARFDAGGTFDRQRSKVVLFDGSNRDQQTWEYGGAAVAVPASDPLGLAVLTGATLLLGMLWLRRK